MKFPNSDFAKQATEIDFTVHKILCKTGLRGSPKRNTTTDRFAVIPNPMGGVKVTIGDWIYWVKTDDHKVISLAFKTWESNQ